MRHLRTALLAISVLLFVDVAPTFGQDLAVLAKDAERLTNCTKRFDAVCVISLSDIEGYQRLARPGFNFPKAQTRFFDRSREAGFKYTRIDVSAPSEVFNADGRVYAFLPYTSVTLFKGRSSEMHAYYIGISRDGGQSWKFIDGRSITRKNIRVIIPGYGGQQLPAVHASNSLGQLRPDHGSLAPTKGVERRGTSSEHSF